MTLRLQSLRQTPDPDTINLKLLHANNFKLTCNKLRLKRKEPNILHILGIKPIVAKFDYNHVHRPLSQNLGTKILKLICGI
jgi:hypothetical protein